MKKRFALVLIFLTAPSLVICAAALSPEDGSIASRTRSSNKRKREQTPETPQQSPAAQNAHASIDPTCAVCRETTEAYHLNTVFTCLIGHPIHDSCFTKLYTHNKLSSTGAVPCPTCKGEWSPLPALTRTSLLFRQAIPVARGLLGDKQAELNQEKELRRAQEQEATQKIAKLQQQCDESTRRVQWDQGEFLRLQTRVMTALREKADAEQKAFAAEQNTFAAHQQAEVAISERNYLQQELHRMRRRGALRDNADDQKENGDCTLLSSLASDQENDSILTECEYKKILS
jgi:hypothetical protein